ncbi:MAG: hypothetical protein HZB46_18485, partial [Solirubrobacterales bacterium]|nr:hypothetical protein [Solirubrobacterales bacterium]
MLQTSWARRASAAVAVIGAMGAIAGPASAGTTFYASTWVDDDGVAQGYVESYPGTPHAGRLDVVRAGSVVATSTGHEWGTWVETLVQPGDELVYTDLDSGQAQQVTVTGRPAFDASVCGTPGSVSGTRDPDGAVDLGAYLYFGPYGSRNDYLEGAVTTLSGEQFAGSYPKVLAPEWRVHVTQTRKLPGDVVFTTSTSRKVGACAPPAAAPAVVPVPAPAPKPPVDTGRPAGKLDVPKAVFAPAAAFRALSAGVFTTTVTVDEPGTVTQTLYLDNG